MRGAGAFAASLAAGSAAAQNASPLASLADGAPFGADALLDIARALSKQPYAAPANDLPESWAALPRERYAAIRGNPNAFLFRGEDRGVTIEPLHRGFVFTRPVQLYVIEDGRMRRLVYDPAAFEFGNLPPPPPGTDLAFSGIRIFGDPVDGQNREVAVFQGGTFFRAMARAQTYGVTARALALRLADNRGEETPYFRALWIERPSVGAKAVNLFALIDSESATAALVATVRPGDVTIIDAQLTVFARAALDNVGVGAMSGMYLFGPNERRSQDDVRPAVYEISGLKMVRGNEEAIWRPVVNPQTLQISIFGDENPRGFGLLQRSRDQIWFQDDEQRFERRPSLWVEPIGDWGAGAVQLVEIPSDSEVNKNIIAYWRPKAPMAAGGEATFAFRQFWWWWPPERTKLAIVTQTRSGKGSSGRRRRFVVDFAGEALGDARATVEMAPTVSASPGAILNVRVMPFPERKSCRVMFELDPGSESMCELRLVLTGSGQPLTETWLYRWTP
ncbi:MAG: glucan biosynthesis protein D [Rhizobiales bacterium 65-9]|nr:MAG: glucan biosynthesis protein D [Rhizobiales bacterium 65-9]